MFVEFAVNGDVVLCFDVFWWHVLSCMWAIRLGVLLIGCVTALGQQEACTQLVSYKCRCAVLKQLHSCVQSRLQSDVQQLLNTAPQV
jgi:hypothetical protein